MRKKVKLLDTGQRNEIFATVYYSEYELELMRHERELKRRREHYQKNKVRISLLRRQNYRRNREKIRQRLREYYKRNKVKIDNRNKKWYHDNRDKMKEYRSRPEVKACQKKYKHEWNLKRRKELKNERKTPISRRKLVPK